MLPDGAHLRAEDWTIFCLNQLTPDPDQQQIVDEEHKSPLLYVLNLVRTKHDATARRFVLVPTPYFIYIFNFSFLLYRGARVKAMAICTRHQYLHIYKVSQ